MASDWDWYDPIKQVPFDFTDFAASVLSEGAMKYNPTRIDLINDFVFENMTTVAKFKEGHREHPSLISLRLNKGRRE